MKLINSLDEKDKDKKITLCPETKGDLNTLKTVSLGKKEPAAGSCEHLLNTQIRSI